MYHPLAIVVWFNFFISDARWIDNVMNDLLRCQRLDKVLKVDFFFFFFVIENYALVVMLE